MEHELKEYKEKWAESQCDLHDSEQKFNETETERQKTLRMLQKTMQSLEEERHKIGELESLIEERTVSGVSDDDAKKVSKIHHVIIKKIISTCI